MTKGLRIAPELELPLDAVTETFAILAKRGSGKTYTAAVMAEEMLEAGLPVCVVDPLGVWWGLKSSADGKEDGYPVYVFGGERADVGLEETAGQVIADVLIDQRIPIVLDLSLFPKAAMRRFMTDFLGRLYHRNRDPLHLIVDEADLFAPQSAESRRGNKVDGEGNSLLGAMEDLVRRGRARGIGATLITQRPAVIHKDVLSQAEVLIALRMTGVRDVNAIDDWVKLHDAEDQAKEVKHSLPALPIGTAWVWSPGWLGILQKVAVRRRRTFDSSATPKMGERRVEPRRMAKVDLEALGAQIAATVERAKEDDPRELRRRIAERDRRIAQLEAREPKIVNVEVPVLAEELVVRLETTLGDLRKHGVEITGVAQDMLDQLQRWPGSALPTGAKVGAATARGGTSTGTPAVRRTAPVQAGTPTHEKRRPPQAQPATSGAAAASDDDVHLKAGARRILETLARHYPMRVTRSQLGTLAKFKVTGGTFLTYWSLLKRVGYVDESGGDIGITQAGLDYVGHVVGEALTTEELLAQWRTALKAGARKMLDELVAVYPDGFTREQLAAVVDMAPTGGTFLTYLGTLRRNGLAEIDGRGVVSASDALFLGGR